MSTQASIVLEFGAGVDSTALILPELDTDLNPDSVQELPGDLDEDGKIILRCEDTDVYFLLHLDAGLAVEWVRPTNGTVQELGEVTRIREDRVRFGCTEQAWEQQLTYNPAGVPSYHWYDTGPDVAAPQQRSIIVAGEEANGLPAIGDASYPVRFRSYRFVPPPVMSIPAGKTEYPIEIRILVVQA